MIDQLPEGKSIGWMQAPPQWIFTHTVRFMGVVRVVIQDGEGFILIKKGKPLVYYFKHGRIELKGRAALDYFKSHPTIEFNLCKYTPEEFSQVLKICNVEERADDIPQEPGVPPETEIPPETDRSPEPYTPPEPEISPQPYLPPEPALSLLEETPFEEAPVYPVVQPEEEPAYAGTAAEDTVVVETPPRKPVVPQPVILEEPDIKIIGQMKKLNGIVAISVFNNDRNILLMGDVAIEPLLKIARTMLSTTAKITPLLDWGSFVHMTLQIPEGNIIIAPYHENNLCILTTRTINIGHIRRILRDLQQSENGIGFE
jgi:hypothetical protein